MKADTLKAVCAFLAGLLVTACAVGFWAGRNIPTAAQVDTLIEQMAETNFLLRASGISWEALNHETHRPAPADMDPPGSPIRGGADPGADGLGDASD